MNKLFRMPATLALVSLITLGACGKADKEAAELDQLRMQADKARMELQEKADALARNPPPELIEAARKQAEAAAKAGQP